MPPSVDVGGIDLYDWAVQLGGLKCEEYLRPVEAAKHGSSEGGALEEAAGKGESGATSASASSGKILDRARPGEEMTLPSLRNRLDELESLASALSTCLDTLAEEVSELCMSVSTAFLMRPMYNPARFAQGVSRSRIRSCVSIFWQNSRSSFDVCSPDASQMIASGAPTSLANSRSACGT